MRKKWAWLVLLLVVAGFWSIGLVRDLFDHTSISHVAIQDWLKLVGAAIYEYHEQTGEWPESLDQLGRTSLAVKMPIWRGVTEKMSYRRVPALKSDPKENSALVLVYYTGGLVSQFGRMWVCWGDLRTEYLTEAQIRAAWGEPQRR